MLKACRTTSPHHGKAGQQSVPKLYQRKFGTRVESAHTEPGNGTESRSAAALGAVELPHGGLWWHDRQHNVYQHDVYHGQDFVLQRQRSGGPGLVLSHRLSSVQIVDKAERERVQLEMYSRGQDNTGAQLALTDMFTFDLTDYALVEESVADATVDAAAPLQFPPTACTGIVLRDQPADHTHQVSKGTKNPATIDKICTDILKTSIYIMQVNDQVSTSHPRRTKAVSSCCTPCTVVSKSLQMLSCYCLHVVVTAGN